jgi:diadenosine tetraphosphate (Ap4A) HIT family hydrolase
MSDKYTANCISCKSEKDPQEKARTIYSDKNLKVVLRVDNQCWLGRCIIVPYEHISPEDMYSTRLDMLANIGEMIGILITTYKRTFGMALSNIAQLGNLTDDENGNKTHIAAYHHCHFHFIPRYVTGHVVHRYGIDFVDKQWGKPLNIDPSLIDVVKPSTDFIDSLVKELRDAIKETMGYK